MKYLRLLWGMKWDIIRRKCKDVSERDMSCGVIEMQIAVAKVGKYATSENGSTFQR